jgi:hypothetical protein
MFKTKPHMKQLLFVLMLLVGAITTNAQGANRPVTFNEQVAFGNFGFERIDDNNVMNLIAFRNYTDDYLEVRLEVKDYGIDQTFILTPGLDYEVFELGLNVMPITRGELVKKGGFRVEITTPDSRLFFLWYKEAQNFK